MANDDRLLTVVPALVSTHIIADPQTTRENEYGKNKALGSCLQAESGSRIFEPAITLGKNSNFTQVQSGRLLIHGTRWPGFGERCGAAGSFCFVCPLAVGQ
ncbi:uncharacterized protein SPSK_04670 [Sporothrix schenckii 1099-18]|uniref:Uncharacterized protein n=1 Tax=Sporothrix schenckii 1099-18 TaxID=1397361 RepID=A0A0F2M031_SPOSC|nr:uncharacterized protein SPSK_04670 [Sporothrix schenckii 1099-18]KJR83062.1 hypothetical protein SPSK_04670 [Sporothrix schenckii 1099-18]